MSIGLAEISAYIRTKSRASALSEKSGRQTDEQTKKFEKTFKLATKSLKNNFVTNRWTDRQRTDGPKSGLQRCTNDIETFKNI